MTKTDWMEKYRFKKGDRVSGQVVNWGSPCDEWETIEGTMPKDINEPYEAYMILDGNGDERIVVNLKRLGE